MIKLTDIAWLAGLLEGEGWFTLRKGRYPVIGLSMTSGDVVAKAASIMKSRVTRYKTSHRTQVTGAHAIRWMFMLYSFLGECRQKEIVRAVRAWKEHPFHNGRKRSMAKCHPDKPLVGHGLCGTCYQREYHRKKLLKRVG